MCRDNAVSVKAPSDQNGSSLRVQGQPVDAEAVPDLSRIIPACAGTTAAAVARDWAPPDHPCVCRDNSAVPPPPPPAQGSSLRVQGQRVPPAHGLVIRRIIPACAGTTPLSSPRVPRHTDHPCVCRDNAEAGADCQGTRGSSLRVQGQPLEAISAGVLFRIIPACAGTTGPRTLPTLAGADHPCVCRDNASQVRTRAFSKGSSLRVQGQQNSQRDCVNADRIIPACAGTTRQD